MVELSDMLAIPPPKNGRKRNSDVELNVIDGDLAHLSERYPNTGAGRGEIPDAEWIRLRSPVRSSLANCFQLQAEGRPVKGMAPALGNIYADVKIKVEAAAARSPKTKEEQHAVE